MFAVPASVVQTQKNTANNSFEKNDDGNKNNKNKNVVG